MGQCGFSPTFILYIEIIQEQRRFNCNTDDCGACQGILMIVKYLMNSKIHEQPDFNTGSKRMQLGQVGVSMSFAYDKHAGT